MVKLLTAAAVLAVLLVPGARPASAKSAWDAPTMGLEMRGMHDSNRFPGSPLTAPDQGAEMAGEIETGRRLSKAHKLGLGLQGGGELWSEFSEASYGWVGGNATLRRGGTQVRGDIEVTPRRLKFPADAEGGQFSRVETRLGLRQALTPGVRLRVEGRHQSDDYAAAYDARDGSTNEGYALLVMRASEALTLRADLAVGRTRTASRKFAHADHVAGAGVTLALGRWRFDAGAWSGLARYADAQSGDSNFRRRDQWLQVRAEARRELHAGLAALAAAEWTDQASSRLDRAYDRSLVQLALAWTRAGK